MAGGSDEVVALLGLDPAPVLWLGFHGSEGQDFISGDVAGDVAG